MKNMTFFAIIAMIITNVTYSTNSAAPGQA